MGSEIDQCICELWEQALEISSNYCSGGLADTQNCQWYHGSWCLLRCLGMVSNPYWHDAFYSRALQKIRPTSVCIVGTADISMPSFVSNYYNGDLDILDICKTPLELGRLFAEKKKLNWNFFHVDVKSMNKHNANYNLVINDAFLTRFRRNERKDVIKDIANIIQPNGYYVTTLRKSIYYDQGYRSKPEKRDEFVNRAIKKAKVIIPNHINIVEKLARTYIDNMLSFPFETLEEVQQLFRSVNLRIIEITEDEVIGESEKSVYFRVIAERS